MKRNERREQKAKYDAKRRLERELTRLRDKDQKKRLRKECSYNVGECERIVKKVSNKGSTCVTKLIVSENIELEKQKTASTADEEDEWEFFGEDEISNEPEWEELKAMAREDKASQCDLGDDEEEDYEMLWAEIFMMEACEEEEKDEQKTEVNVDSELGDMFDTASDEVDEDWSFLFPDIV